MQTPATPGPEALEHARRMFRAVLAPWASDLLELRRRGLDRPSFRRAVGPALRPAGAPMSSASRERRGSVPTATNTGRSQRRAA
jgi:hypothetical protein